MNRRTGLAIIIVAVSVVCVAGTGILASAAPVNNSTVADTGTISVENQTTNGTTVTIENVTLPGGGFISIHNQSYLPPENESVTSVLGASAYLKPGRHEDVEVVLNQPLSKNQLIVARASRDGNANQSFDYVSSQGFIDTGYSRNSTGTAVDDRATIRVKNATSLAKQATITFANQTTNGTNVTVTNVTVPEGGFVAVHKTSFLPPENKTQKSMIGTSGYLSPGVHHNVTIQLDTALEEDTPLLASPYRDTNGNESFEYLSSNARNDTPYAPPGSTALISRANVTVNTNSASSFTESGAEGTTESSGSSLAATFDYLEIGVVVCMILLGYFYLRVTG
jgi:hypothetical protein